MQINLNNGLQNGNKIFHEVPNLKVSFPPHFIPPLLYCTENTTICTTNAFQSLLKTFSHANVGRSERA